VGNGIFDLEGKTAIVTGASMGLGQAIAVGLAEFGANVALADIADMSYTADLVKKSGRDALQFTTDVRHRDQVDHAVDSTFEQFGSVDIMVNNAALFAAGPAEDVSEELWDDVMETNLKGVFLGCQAAGRHMRKSGYGRIINLSSITGLIGYGGCAPYNASKAGVILYTKTIAVEWAKYGINANAICPAYFLTPLNEKYVSQGLPGAAGAEIDSLDRVRSRIPIGGGQRHPRDIVGTSVWLASDASAYVTGQSIAVDGGWTAGLL
jgi:NAD(P)-dependent dehydrogenase (short-subunit alcohol dehydrogenase family)